MSRLFLLFLVCLFSVNNSFSQSNSEVARVYFERAMQSLDENKEKKAEEYFEKGQNLLGGDVQSTEDANLGAMIYFRLKKYDKSKEYVEKFFSLSPKKGSLEYKTMLEVFVTCDEKIKEEEEKKRLLEEERIRKEREKRRIDSLTRLWRVKSEDFLVIADTVYPFNKEGVALYQKNGSFGILSDKGVIVKEAKNDNFGCNFEDHILIVNKIDFPTKISIYDCKAAKFLKVPSVSEIGPLTTNYGKVLLVRANMNLVLYPDNFPSVFIYNLKNQKIQLKSAEEQKRILGQLEQLRVIDRYKSDGRLKVNGIWYSWGGYLDGGVVVLFKERTTSLAGFLFSSKKKFIPISELNYLGQFYEDKVQGLKENQIVWLNRRGDELKEREAISEYLGKSIVKKKDNNSIFIINTENQRILKDGEELPSLKEFLDSASKN